MDDNKQARHDQICTYNVCRKPSPTASTVGHSGDFNYGIIMSEDTDHQHFAMKLMALPLPAGLQSQRTSQRIAGDGSSSLCTPTRLTVTHSTS